MDVDSTRPHLGALASRWWMLVVRGIAAILFGIFALARPGAGLLALVILWGAYAITDGVFSLLLAARAGRTGRRWAWLLFEGVVSTAAGAFTFLWPGMTALVLLTVIAVWAMLTGVAEIATAIRLRRQIEGEWLLVSSGMLSIAFGALLLSFPGSGALALVWMIGGYAIVFGALLIGLALRLRRWDRSHERPMPTGGARAHA